MNHPARFWRLAARGSLLLAALASTALAVELALRLAGYTYSPMTIDSRESLTEALPPTKGDARAVHLFQDGHFVYDPLLLWRPRANRSVFNALGYRGPELERDKPPGEIRLIALGDSNTLGWSGPQGPNWPEDLGDLLAETGPAFRVVNAGVWGYTVYQGERRLRELLHLEPDLVLVSFGGNDAHPVFVPDAEYARRLSGPSWVALSGLKLGGLVAAAWDRIRSREGDGGTAHLRHRVPLDQYETHLRRLAELSRERGFAIALLTRPYRGRSLDQRRWKRWAPEYREATRRVAAETGVLLVDVYSEFEGRRELFKDESHFTGLGHRAAAKFVYDRLAPILTRDLGVEPSRLLTPGSGLKPEVEIDFGTAEARRSLVAGFAGKDLVRGRSAVKNNRQRAAIDFALDPEDSPYSLTVEARPFRRQRVASVSARLNGVELGSFQVEADWRRYAIDVPVAALRSGVNRLELVHETVATESASAGGAVVLYDRLTLAPADGAAQSTP